MSNLQNIVRHCAAGDGRAAEACASAVAEGTEQSRAATCKNVARRIADAPGRLFGRKKTARMAKAAGKMKARVLLALLLSTVFMGSGVPQNTVFNISGTVKDTAGRGVEGVVVNDGINFTVTDGDGRWTLRTDTVASKYISISTPAGYRLPSNDGIAAGFYVAAGTAVSGNGCDFVLEKRGKTDGSFYYIAISDPQVRTQEDMRRWREETMKDIRGTVDSLRRSREVVGIALGDLVFDNMPLYSDYIKSVKNTGMTMFQCIGNHDFDKRWQDLHNMRLGTPVYGEMEYNRHFGPTDYSFNIGKAHVITMKSIDYAGGKKYQEHITDQQIAWLEKDLSYVPKGSLVLLNIHAAGWNAEGGEGNIRNAGQLEKALEGYRVHVFCGHTHFYQNVVVNDNLYQHNIGAACGAWWTGWINRCGAPNGYLIVDVNGDDLRWHYKSTGYPMSHQLAVYGLGEFSTQKDYVVANVWDYDPECRVEWYQDGRAMGTMERFSDVDEGYNSRYAKRKSDSETPHLFRCKPSGAYSEIKVVFTNRFGEQYSAVTKPGVEVIAHRGGAGLYPENTIEAMLNAVKIGIRNLELDLHVTKDSIVVVSHDPHLKGYGKQYPIYANTYSTLAGLTIGDKADKRFPGRKDVACHIPTVTELIDSVEAYCHRHNLPPVKYTIEIKSTEGKDGKLSPDYKTFADLCVRALASRSLGSRLLLQSFDVRTLKYVHEKYPNIRLLYLVDKSAGSYGEAMARIGFTPYAISPDFPMITQDFVSKAKAEGMRVKPYTVDTKEATLKMKEAGVDAIITNYPDRVTRWLNE